MKSSFTLFSLGVINLALLVLPSRSSFGAIEDIVGHYEGSWSNITFFSSGAAVIDIDVMGNSASLTFDMDGGVFGGTNPASITMPGTVQGDTIQIDNQGVGIYGDIKGSVDSAQGTLSVLLTNIPSPSIDYVTVVGTTTNNTLDLDYRVYFPAGGIGLPPFADGIMMASLAQLLTIDSISVEGENLVLGWTGGVPPFTVQARNDLEQGMWTNAVTSVSSNNLTFPYSKSGNAYFRVSGQ